MVRFQNLETNESLQFKLEEADGNNSKGKGESEEQTQSHIYIYIYIYIQEVRHVKQLRI